MDATELAESGRVGAFMDEGVSGRTCVGKAPPSCLRVLFAVAEGVDVGRLMSRTRSDEIDNVRSSGVSSTKWADVGTGVDERPSCAAAGASLGRWLSFSGSFSRDLRPFQTGQEGILSR